MSAIAAMIVVCKADPALLAVIGDRFADHDIRRSGWESDPKYFIADGVIRPTLVFADADEPNAAFTHSAVRQPQVDIFAMADRSSQGRGTVRALVMRLDEVLSGWRDPATGAQYFRTFASRMVVDDHDVTIRITFTGGRVAAIRTY